MIKPIPLTAAPLRNVDETELSENSSRLVSCFRDELGACVKQPGIVEYLTLPGTAELPISGFYWWQKKEALMIVSGDRLFKLTKPGGVPAIADITSAKLSLSTRRPSFAVAIDLSTGNEHLFITNGGSLVRSDGTTTTAVTGANAPTASSHVAFLDNYILANELGTGEFKWSVENAPLDWSNALYYANAMGKPDALSALFVKNREIFCIGPQSTEIWENDGVTPFSRISGGFIDRGIIAPDSVAQTEEGLMWLSDRNKVVFFNGRSLESISTPYDKEIQSFSKTSDCYADYFEILGKALVAFTFPTVNRTLVWNHSQKEWSEFAKWDPSQACYLKWNATAIHYSPDWGQTFVAIPDSKTVHILSSSTYSDATGPIRMLILTGLVDHGIMAPKRCNKVVLRIKRGSQFSGEAKLMVRWRDDNKATWSNTHEYSLGVTGDTDVTLRLFALGVYTTRQWEFTCSDAVPLVITKADEEFDVLQ